MLVGGLLAVLTATLACACDDPAQQRGVVQQQMSAEAESQLRSAAPARLIVGEHRRARAAAALADGRYQEAIAAADAAKSELEPLASLRPPVPRADALLQQVQSLAAEAHATFDATVLVARAKRIAALDGAHADVLGFDDSLRGLEVELRAVGDAARRRLGDDVAIAEAAVAYRRRAIAPRVASERLADDRRRARSAPTDSVEPEFNGGGSTYVRGYYRRGHYVRGYVRRR